MTHLIRNAALTATSSAALVLRLLGPAPPWG